MNRLVGEDNSPQPSTGDWQRVDLLASKRRSEIFDGDGDGPQECAAGLRNADAKAYNGASVGEWEAYLAEPRSGADAQ